MVEAFVSNVTNLRMFVLVSVVMMIGVGIFLLITCRTFSWEGKNQKLFGFFYQMKWSDTIGLAVSFIKCSLFCSLLVTAGNVKLIHIAVYVVLHILYIIFRRNLKGLPLDLVMGAVSAGLLLLMNMLHSYLTDVIFDAKIQAILILLGVLLVIYGLTDLFHFCKSILERASKRRKRVLADATNKEANE